MLKYITLPHVSTYKWRWLRRIMIIVSVPQEIVRAYWLAPINVIRGAKYWWDQP